MSLRLISNIRPSDSLLFYYLKVPILKRILGSTSIVGGYDLSLIGSHGAVGLSVGLSVGRSVGRS